jgi:hypothetical protein
LEELVSVSVEGRAAVDAMQGDQKILFSIVQEDVNTVLLAVDGEFVKRHADIFSCVFELSLHEKEEGKLNEEERGLVQKSLFEILTHWYDYECDNMDALKEGVTSIKCCHSFSSIDFCKEKIVRMIHFFM